MPETPKKPESADSTVELWPPRGFSSYYAVTERIDGQPELSYDLVVPGKFAEFDLSTVRIGRHGGPNDTDLEFRSVLYSRIGAVTVAAGRVEMAMKRLLLVLTAPKHARFSTVDLTWTGLVKALRKQCDGSDHRRKQLADVLDWAEKQEVKRRRDDAIHADWWDFAGCRVRRARFIRGSNGTTIDATLTDLDEDARLLSDYALRLDELLGNDWMIARLPGPFRVRDGVTVSPLADAEGG